MDLVQNDGKAVDVRLLHELVSGRGDEAATVVPVLQEELGGVSQSQQLRGPSIQVKEWFGLVLCMSGYL